MEVLVNDNDFQGKKNIETTMAIYEGMINQKKPMETVKKYLTDDYVQHNPLIETGNEGLARFFAAVQERNPRVRVVVHKAIAVQEYVWTHVNFFNTMNNDADDLGVAGVDIFRFTPEGLLAEHWDTLQVIEDPAKAANTNGMF